MYSLELYESGTGFQNHYYTTLEEAVANILPLAQAELPSSYIAVKVYKGSRYSNKNIIVIDKDGMPFSSLIKFSITSDYNSRKFFRWIIGNKTLLMYSPETIEIALKNIKLCPENYVMPADIEYHITVTRGTKSESISGKNLASTIGKIKKLWQTQNGV